MPVLREGTSRMTRAASDCTGEHGKNYLDSRLMSEIAILRHLFCTSGLPLTGAPVPFSISPFRGGGSRDRSVHSLLICPVAAFF